MTQPAHRRTVNIERSVYMHLYTTFEQPNSDLRDAVNYGVSDFKSSGKDKWVVLMFLSSGAGKKGVSLMQVDVYTRIGKDLDDVSGSECGRVMQLLIDAMRVRTIQLYDFATPASPVLLTDRKLLVQNGEGKFREPDDTRVWGEFEDNLARRTATYRLRVLDDASQASDYY